MSLFSKRKIILSAFSGFREFLLAEITAPAELNKRSDGTLVPGMEKYCLTSLVIRGYRCSRRDGRSTDVRDRRSTNFAENLVHQQRTFLVFFESKIIPYRTLRSWMSINGELFFVLRYCRLGYSHLSCHVQLYE